MTDNLQTRASLRKNLKDLTNHKDELNYHIKVEIFNMLSNFASSMLEAKHPVLNIQLVPSHLIKKNDYNPNKFASPEFKLLERSLKTDGLTMPIIVSEPDLLGYYTVIDGAHRLSLIRKTKSLYEMTHGYIPVSILPTSEATRIPSTVRHNIARGTHQVELTASLVTRLKSMNWSNKKIGEELGMDPDEVLRMQQVTGLAEAFKNEEFSMAWE